MGATIIADDLTGACDTGCLFAGRGPVRVIAEPALPTSEAEVVAVDTESRPLPPHDAARRVSGAAARLDGRLQGGRLFKKIDSTLRGPVGAELEALLETGRFQSALVCPAFPDQRRMVIDGLLLVDGIPAHESAVGRDPAYPGPTADVAEILNRHIGRPVARLPLGDVRAGVEKVVHAVERSPGHLIAADAETDADLTTLALAAAALPSLLVAGSAGLGHALAQALGYAGRPVRLPRGRRWLVVVGSVHPASRAQLATLIATGAPGVWVKAGGEPDMSPAVTALLAGRPAWAATHPPESPGACADASQRAAHLGRVAAAIIRRATPDLVVVTGGETAYALIHGLPARRLDLLGAPASGLALGRMVVTDMSPLPLLTKAGGFGAADLLTALLRGTRR